MNVQHIRLDLYECVCLLDLAHFNFCLGNDNNAKTQCLETVKILNRISKASTQEYSKIIRDLSVFTLKFYDSITKGIHFSYNEKIIWLSSKMNGQLYPPCISYSDTLDSFNNMLLPVTDVKSNLNDNLPLPESINAHYEEVRNLNWSLDYNDLTNLCQDLLTNCSFVSSFLSLVENRKDLLDDLISPHEDVSLFKCRFYFNGCPRLVAIDNTIPFVKDANRNLTINSMSNENLYWPALVEKAYLKVLGGGYNFGGSNMAIDTFMLTSWIPEIIPIRNNNITNCDIIWDYYLSKKVLLGLGTGRLSTELSQNLNLISGHDYLLESFDPKENTIVLKNPWIENNSNYQRTSVISITDLYHFNYFYINWNPDSFFRFKFQMTFLHKEDNQGDVHIYQKPQYSLVNTSEDHQDVWLLLEKHLPYKDSSEEIINIVVYESHSGDRIIVPNQYIRINKDSSTNSRLLLLKIKMKPLQAYTIVTSSTVKNTFTLYMYNNISETFRLTKAKYKYPNLMPIIYDKWSLGNSGGNWSFSSYIDNPQYDIMLNRSSANLMIGLYSEFADKFVNFHIFQSDPSEESRCIKLFDKTKLIFDEKYNMTFQFHEIKNLHPGLYKLVLSSYDNNLEGNFEVFVLHDVPEDNLTITKTHTSLGLFERKREFEWNNSNRFKLYFQTTQFNSHLTFHIKHYNQITKQIESLSDYRPSLRGSIFNAENSQPIVINEEWNSSLYGLFVECDIQDPGTYILLIERFELGSGQCKVEIGCNRKFTIV